MKLWCIAVADSGLCTTPTQPLRIGLLLVDSSRALLEHSSVPSNTNYPTEAPRAVAETLMNNFVAVALGFIPEAPVKSCGPASNGTSHAFIRAW